MRAADLDLIFVPESGEVSPDHWIARWGGKLSTAQVIKADGPKETRDAIVAAARAATRPALLIGHSTGAHAIAHAAADLGDTAVRGAVLVAPPAADSLASLDDGAWPEPARAPLPFPSLVIASRTDPWASLRQSQELAESWGADFVDAGESGRIDADSGHGPWPDGLLRLGGFLKRLG